MGASSSSANAVEVDARFPSGPWRGYWEQNLVRGWMDLHFTFAAGRLSGWGHDALGHFVVHGRYDLATGQVTFEKLIINKHLVNYLGQCRAGMIAGRWSIPHDDQGPFRVWPKALGDHGPLEAQHADHWPEELRAPSAPAPLPGEASSG